jgi:hypothetical protein
VDRERGGDGEVPVGEFLVDDAVGDRAGVEAAVLLGNLQPREVQVREPVPDPFGELLILVGLVGGRLDLLLDELPDGLADQSLLVCQFHRRLFGSESTKAPVRRRAAAATLESQFADAVRGGGHIQLVLRTEVQQRSADVQLAPGHNLLDECC